MERITDKDINEDLINALAARCVSSFADSLLAGKRRAEDLVPEYLVLKSSMSDDDSFILLFSDAKGKVVDEVTLIGTDAVRALEHPGSVVSAAKNFKASRVALCVRSVRGRVDERLALSAANHISGQKRVRLSDFVYIGNGEVRSVDCGRASRVSCNTDD